MDYFSFVFMYVFDCGFAIGWAKPSCQPFEPQFEQHAASTEVPALHYKPVDRHLASAHIVPAGRSYYQGLYQDSPAGYLNAPGLPLLSPLRFEITHAIALPCLEE